MLRRTTALLPLAVAAFLVLGDAGTAQEFKSGLLPGQKGASQFIGGPFQPIVVSGKRLDLLRQAFKHELELKNKELVKKDQPPIKVEEELKRYEEFPHSPVSEFGLMPVVAIFIREGPEPNVPLTRKLLEKVDEAIEHYPVGELSSFAIVVTPDAHSSATQAEKDVDAVLKEAKVRAGLAVKVKELAKGLKHVVVGYYPPEKLEAWKLNPEPGVTILFYVKHQVQANHAFAEGKWKEEDIDQVLKDVDMRLKKLRKRPAPKG